MAARQQSLGEANPRADAILKFWFGAKPEQWFEKDVDFDHEITDRFMGDYEDARDGMFDDWRRSPQNCLALILLLDQFPRNMFRGDPLAFATDSLAIDHADHAIARGFDRSVSIDHRTFFYMPFQHAEDMAAQNLSIALFHDLPGWDQPGSPYQFALRHWDIIRRFGRFPHRNAVLGRPSTDAEREFLKQPDSGF